MRRIAQLGLLLSLSGACAAQIVVDRMVVVINKHVITQSDWDEQERFEALAEGRSPKSVEHSAAALERLIDRELISEHITNVSFQHATPEQVAKQVSEIRKEIAAQQSQTDEDWKRTLAQYSLTEEDIEDIISAQLDVLRLVEVRFRSSVQVSPEEVAAYYKESFLPELTKTGSNGSQPSLDQVKDKIKELLVEQRVNEMLNTWIQSLRNQADIQRLDAPSPAAQKTGNPTRHE
jgi:parvulin-like peptidyl-prolyl isomerase